MRFTDTLFYATPSRRLSNLLKSEKCFDPQTKTKLSNHSANLETRDARSVFTEFHDSLRPTKDCFDIKAMFLFSASSSSLANNNNNNNKRN